MLLLLSALRCIFYRSISLMQFHLPMILFAINKYVFCSGNNCRFACKRSLECFVCLLRMLCDFKKKVSIRFKNSLSSFNLKTSFFSASLLSNLVNQYETLISLSSDVLGKFELLGPNHALTFIVFDFPSITTWKLNQLNFSY